MPDKMSRSDREALEDFARRLRQVYPEARVWAFGSRVRGEARQDSDLDICVLVNRRTPEARRKISEIGWEVGFDHEVLLTTVVFTAVEFENGPMASGPLARTIRGEGVAA